MPNNIITVRDLINQLEEYDGEMPVVMSSDSEGNNFSPLYEVIAMHHDENMEPALEELDKLPYAVFLYPTH